MARRPNPKVEDLQMVDHLRARGATLIEMKRGRILRVEFKEVVREVTKEVPAPIAPRETEEQRLKREHTELQQMLDWSSGP